MSDKQPETSDFLISSSSSAAKQAVEAVISRLKLVTGARNEKELSEFFGYGSTAMTNKRQRRRVPYEEAHQVALAWGIDLNWLLLGQGDPPAGLEHVGVADLPAPYARAFGAHDEFLSVPLYDIEAAAGDGALFDAEQVKTWLHYRRDWLTAEGLNENALVAVSVRGDSMYPTLKTGDVTLVDRSVTEPDGVYLIRVGEALRIKRLQRLADGGLRVSSDNEHYAPEIIAAAELRGVEIIGHCHEHCGRVY